MELIPPLEHPEFLCRQTLRNFGDLADIFAHRSRALGSLGNATIRCPLWQTGRYCTALAAVAHLWGAVSLVNSVTKKWGVVIEPGETFL